MRWLMLVVMLLAGCGASKPPKPKLGNIESVSDEFLPLAKAELEKRGIKGDLSDGSGATLNLSPVPNSNVFAAGKINTKDGIKTWVVAFSLTTFNGGRERDIKVVQVRYDGKVIP